MDLKERRSINHRRKERFTVVFTWWFHVVIQQTTSKNSTEMRHSSNQIIVFWRYLCRCSRLYLSLFISLARRKTYWQKSTFAFPKTWNDELLIKTGKFHKTKLLFLSYNFLCSCSCLVKKGKRKETILRSFIFPARFMKGKFLATHLLETRCLGSIITHLLLCNGLFFLRT